MENNYINEQLLKQIATEQNVKITQILAVLKLIEDGATVPFIARYRKEVTGGLNEEQIRAFRLADNKTAEIAGWDFHLLELELAKITELDMEAFGFKESETVYIDDFFKQKNRVEKEEQPHIITCPYCGEMISLTKDFCIIEDENE